jgi:predicted RNA-binding Zn ribbon-like protein
MPRALSETIDMPAHVEPGLRWLDLVGTRVNWPAAVPVEKLPDVAALARWFEQHGIRPEAEPTNADLASVRQVRAALRELAVARAQHRAAHPQALDTVNAALARAFRTPRHIVVPDPFEPGRLRRRLPDVDAALMLVIEESVDSLAGHNAAHLRQCEDSTCGALFFDVSGRRRWCSAQSCGTRARVRAHRARQRAADPQPP